MAALLVELLGRLFSGDHLSPCLVQELRWEVWSPLLRQWQELFLGLANQTPVVLAKLILPLFVIHILLFFLDKFLGTFVISFPHIPC